MVKAADPAANAQENLSYMTLGAGGSAQAAFATYIGERRSRHYLPPYAAGHEFPRPPKTRKAPPVAEMPKPDAESPEHRPRSSDPWAAGQRVRDLGGEFGEGVIDKAPDANGYVIVKFRHRLERIPKDELMPL